MKERGRSRVWQEDLIEGFTALGLKPGVRIMVHSSLSSFGYVVGGAETVIDALMEVITPEGTLMMPTFNHGAPFRLGGPGYFDPKETPTSNGAIPEAFRHRSGVFRSLNPTHPFAVWGDDAQHYVADHHRRLTMGPESPLGLLCSDGGYALLLGVDYTSNTFHHVVEMSTGAPCLGLRTEAYPIRLPDGRKVIGRTWGWRAKPCPFTDQDRYADRMASFHRQMTLGDAVVTLYRLRDGFDVVRKILAEGRDGFPSCSECPIRPRNVPQTVVSDWDPDTNRPEPGSEAWTY